MTTPASAASRIRLASVPRGIPGVLQAVSFLGDFAAKARAGISREALLEQAGRDFAEHCGDVHHLDPETKDILDRCLFDVSGAVGVLDARTAALSLLRRLGSLPDPVGRSVLTAVLRGLPEIRPETEGDKRDLRRREARTRPIDFLAAALGADAAKVPVGSLIAGAAAHFAEIESLVEIIQVVLGRPSPQIIYEVEAMVSKDRAQEWLRFLQEDHWPKILDVDGITGAELLVPDPNPPEVDEDEDPHGTTLGKLFFTARYGFVRLSGYDVYVLNHASRLRDDVVRNFGEPGEDVTLTRRVFDVRT